MNTETKTNAEVDASAQQLDPATAAGLLWLLLDDVSNLVDAHEASPDPEFLAKLKSTAALRVVVGTPNLKMVRHCQALLPAVSAMAVRMQDAANKAAEPPAPKTDA